MIDQGVGSIIHDDAVYAIIGSQSQAETSDNRDCDIRKGVRNWGMAGRVPLRPEAEDVFRRLAGIGHTQRELAEALGIEENKVSKVKSGDRQWKALELLRAREWLAQREEEQSILDLAHAAEIEVEHSRLPDHLPTRSASADDGVVEITSLDLSLSMGPGTVIDEFIEAEPIKMDTTVLRSITRSPFECLRLVRGIGDCMEPTLRTNDRVLVDTSETMMSRLHGIYWIDYEGAHGLKRLRPAGNQRIKVMSDNQDSGDQFEVDAVELRIHGRAIWFSRDL